MIKIINDDCLNYFQSSEFKKIILEREVIIVTDPPFNIGYHYNNYKDKMKEDDYYNWLKKIFSYSEEVVCIHYPENLYRISYEINKFPNKVVSWVYNSNTRKQHRDIAFFGVKPDFSKVKQPYKNLKDKRILDRIKNGFIGANLYDWWNINQVKNVSKEKTCHPCQMPLQVMKNIIGILPNDAIIVDPFMGSGTTAIACKELNRDFIGIEFDKMYFEIAKERIENYQKTQELY